MKSKPRFMKMLNRDSTFEYLAKLETTVDRVSNLREHLSLFRDDLKLLTEGCTFHWAVDFSEIFGYAYPLAGEYQSRHPWEPPEDEFAEYQTALAYAFSRNMAPLVLLPPYQTELRDHLAAVRDKAIRAFEQLQFLITIGKRFTQDEETQKRVRGVLNKYAMKRTLDAEDMRVLIEYGKTHYAELFGLLTSGIQKGIRRIHDLQSDGRLQNIKAHFALPLTIEHRSVQAGAGNWLEGLEAMRPATKYANQLDAYACEYLRIINEKINAQDHILIILTRSTAVQRVLKTKQTISFGPSNQPILGARDLDYVLCRMINWKSNPENSLMHAKKILKTLNEFNQYIPRLKAAAKKLKLGRLERTRTLRDPKIETMIRNAAKLTDDMEGSLISYNNLKVALGTDSRLIRHLENSRNNAHSQIVQVAEQAIRFVRVLRGEPTMHRELTEETKLLWKEVDVAGGLVGDLVDIAPFIKGERLQSVKTQRYEGKETLVTGPVGDMPCTVQIREPKIAELADKFFAALEGDRQGVQEAISGVIEMVFSEARHPEAFLLMSYIQGILNRWGKSKTLIEEGIRLFGDNSKYVVHELLFWKAVVLRKAYPARIWAALRTCHAARKRKLAKYRCEDPRYLKELGYLVWRYVSQKQGLRTLSGKRPKYTIDTAIRYTLRGLESVRDSNQVCIQLLNNLTYFYLDRNMADDLQKAQEAFDQLKKLIDQESWPASIHDTYAYLISRKVEKGILKRSSLSKAKRELNKAEKDPSLGLFERELVRSHGEKLRKLGQTRKN